MTAKLTLELEEVAVFGALLFGIRTTDLPTFAGYWFSSSPPLC